MYPKNLSLMCLPKILTPSFTQRGEFCLDRAGDQFSVGSGGGGYGVLLRDSSQYEYLLGILNSALVNWFVQRITTPFHSGWFAYNKQFIDQIPIKLPETAAEKQLANRIVESVQVIIDAKFKLRATMLSDRESKALEGDIESHEQRIDHAVFHLYGINGLPS